MSVVVHSLITVPQRLLIQSAALLFALLLVGCAARIDALKVAPDFDYAAIIAGGLAIGAVVSTQQLQPAAVRNQRAELLQREISSERSAYSIISAGVLAEQLDGQYQQLADDYRTSGRLSENNLRTLRQAAIGARYIVFVRIENTEIDRDRHEREHVVPDAEGNLRFFNTTVIRITARSVTASAKIIDRQSGADVWSGALTQRVINQRQRIVRWPFSVFDSEHDYPSAPSMDRALRAVFAGLAENFPEPR